jgi:hypothetical protein
MEPVNNKSLLHFIFGQMEKLDSGKTDVQTARAQAELAKQANNALKYENDRAEVLMKLEVHNKEFGTNLQLRSVEGKLFE